MTKEKATTKTEPSRHLMIGIYLNDHLAGATAGTQLARRMARSHQGREEGSNLQAIAAEIGRDRAALLDIMASLGVAVRGYKAGAAWIGEKAGRLKFNGRVLARSPLSDLEELELLRLGVEGKAAAGARCGHRPTPTPGSTPSGSTSSLPGRRPRPSSLKNS